MKLQSVKKGSFFSCYLLTSLSPTNKGQTYIGFTVNPMRRIRQHNGEIGCGALKTKRKRPWEMVMCIYGFPTNVSALQFEWAWQHPKQSLAVRKVAVELKSLSGVANKIKLAYAMLTLPSWQSLNLTVNFFSTKYTTHCASCPSLPDHMKVQVQSMDDLPRYHASANFSDEDECDLIDGDESSHSGSPVDIVPEDIDAECGNSYDHQNDKVSELGQEKQLSDDSANEQNLTEITNDSSLDERQTPETSVFPQNLPTDEKYCSTLDDTSTRDSYAFTQQNAHSYNPHDFPTSRSASLSKGHLSGSHVNNLDACRPNDAESTPASRVFVSSIEVEVIDLMTPSPDCRVGKLSKKKRDCSIIDLTRLGSGQACTRQSPQLPLGRTSAAFTSSEPANGDLEDTLLRLIHDHNQSSLKLRDFNEKAKKKAVRSAGRVSELLVDTVNGGVQEAFVNQKRIEIEIRALTETILRFGKQTDQWLAASHTINTAVKEIGDFENWMKTMEFDCRSITAAIRNIHET